MSVRVGVGRSSFFFLGLSAPLPTKIAFFVGLSENLGPVTEHTDIVFDRVVTNIGSAYNPKTGRFTSPVNATYQFNVVISAQGKQKVGQIDHDPIREKALSLNSVQHQMCSLLHRHFGVPYFAKF